MKLDEGTTARYARELGRINLENHRNLKAAGLETYPSRIGRTEVNHLRRCYPVHDGIFRTQQQHLQYLGIFLSWCGNRIVQEMHLRWSEGVNPKTDWLLPEEMERVREAVQGHPEYRILYLLEGCMGLRRVEVERLRIQDVGREWIQVLGKGRSGGKPRKVWKHPEWDEVFKAYMDRRESIIRTALAHDPTMKIPDGLMLYWHSGSLGSCKRTALDRMVAGMRVLSGVRFGHHTLRRTCGRELWKAEVPLETISYILGHSDTKQTIRYLGINLEDQGSGMELLYQRQLQTRTENPANPLKATNLHQIT